MKQKHKKRDKLKLKPTLKEKRHYLIIEILSLENLNEQDIKNKIESSIKNFIGLLGLACSGPIFVKIEEKRIKDTYKCNDLSVCSEDKVMKKENNESQEIMNTDNKTYGLNTYRHKYLITLSITTKYVDYVKTSLLLWKDKNLKMKCIGVSGTLKKSKRFFSVPKK